MALCRYTFALVLLAGTIGCAPSGVRILSNRQYLLEHRREVARIRIDEAVAATSVADPDTVRCTLLYNRKNDLQIAGYSLTGIGGGVTIGSQAAQNANSNAAKYILGGVGGGLVGIGAVLAIVGVVTQHDFDLAPCKVDPAYIGGGHEPAPKSDVREAEPPENKDPLGPGSKP